MIAIKIGEEISKALKPSAIILGKVGQCGHAEQSGPVPVLAKLRKPKKIIWLTAAMYKKKAKLHVKIAK